jgi:predicted Zn-dependent protease
MRRAGAIPFYVVGRGVFRVAALVSLVAVPAQAREAQDQLRAVETRVAGMVISGDMERRIGLQYKHELEATKGVVYLEDQWVLEYVRTVAARIIDVAKLERPDVQWTVMVINDRKTVNACATPGGFIYIYRGLLEAANDEAELAGIIAHEAGHVVARHTARSIVTAFGLDAVTRLALGKNAGLLTRLAARGGAKGLLLAHSREEESEADEHGARYAAAAGYDPQALSRFFGTLIKRHGSATGLQAYLSDHPATAERIDHVNAYIAEHGYTGEATNRQDYTSMKRYLVTLPAGRPAVARPWFENPTQQPAAPAQWPPPQ